METGTWTGNYLEDEIEWAIYPGAYVKTSDGTIIRLPTTGGRHSGKRNGWRYETEIREQNGQLFLRWFRAEKPLALPVDDQP